MQLQRVPESHQASAGINNFTLSLVHHLTAPSWWRIIILTHNYRLEMFAGWGEKKQIEKKRATTDFSPGVALCRTELQHDVKVAHTRHRDFATDNITIITRDNEQAFYLW